MHFTAQLLFALDHSGCVIKWSPSTASDIDGYHVYMKKGKQGAFQRINSQTITDSSFVSPPLRYDTTYYFYITAVDNSDNESAPSEIISFQLKDKTEPESEIVIPSPHLLKIKAGTKTAQPLFSSDVFTRFQIGGPL